MYYNAVKGVLMMNKLEVLIVEDDENDSKSLIAEINANADKLHLAGALIFVKKPANLPQFMQIFYPHANHTQAHTLLSSLIFFQIYGAFFMQFGDFLGTKRLINGNI